MNRAETVQSACKDPSLFGVMRRFLVLLHVVLSVAGSSGANTRYERRKSYKHTPYGSHIASTGSYTQNKGKDFLFGH